MGKPTKIPDLMTFGMKDLDRKQEILVDMSNLGKQVIVRATHGHVQDLLATYFSRPRADLEDLLRVVLRGVLPFDDDGNWEKQAITCTTKRAAACMEWKHFCDDCLIVQCLRLALYGKPLVLTSMDYRNTIAPPGTGLPTIKIRSTLKATLKKAARLGSVTVMPPP